MSSNENLSPKTVMASLYTAQFLERSLTVGFSCSQIIYIQVNILESFTGSYQDRKTKQIDKKKFFRF